MGSGPGVVERESVSSGARAIKGGVPSRAIQTADMPSLRVAPDRPSFVDRSVHMPAIPLPCGRGHSRPIFISSARVLELTARFQGIYNGELPGLCVLSPLPRTNDNASRNPARELLWGLASPMSIARVTCLQRLCLGLLVRQVRLPPTLRTVGKHAIGCAHFVLSVHVHFLL